MYEPNSDISLWLHNTVTKRLLAQVQDEVSSINMTIIGGECSEIQYKYLAGRISGLRAIEDYITLLGSEARGD